MNTLNLASKIYRCQVMHQRLLPRGHFFKYGVFMLYLDLDELDQLDALLPLFSRNRFNLFSFYDSDHLISAASQSKLTVSPSLKERLTCYLAEEGVITSDPAKFEGKIFLLTYPRILGYVFNPVSFYFVFDQGKPMAAVAEVGNTFAEMKMFLLDTNHLKLDTTFDLLVAKHFYVSPFSSLSDYFHFLLPLPKEKLNLSVNTLGPLGETILVTNVSGLSQSIANLNFALFMQYPLLTFKVIASIHFHALILWLKKIPFYAKEDSPELQIDVLSRHEKENKHVRV